MRHRPRKPEVAPDAATIALFGPGVADIETANATAEKNQAGASECMVHLITSAHRINQVGAWTAHLKATIL